MAFAWQRRWSRLTRLSWAEARTRISQESSKRLDLALHRIGLGPRATTLLSQPSLDSIFFLGKNSDEVAHRAALLRQHLPEEAERVIAEADKICRHEFHLLGYENLNYGPEIDWHSDPVHGRRSPLKPWFKIEFLDFHEVGDHKIIWELSRHQHLVTLAKAWRLTGKRAYANELAQQWYSWQKANPYPLGINWASALEAGFRSLSWLWVGNLLAACPDLTAAFQTDLLLALQMHGRHIERYLSTYYSPNTHLLGEAVALFFLGTLCPEISAAERWRNRGWKIVLEESERQVRSDGVYFEQSLYYHVYALDFFLHARRLASQSGFAIPERFSGTLEKMLNVVLSLSEVGPPEGFGDDDGGRVFNPRRNRVEHMTDPLALGAALYDCDQYAFPALTEEAIWLFGDEAIQAFAKPRRQPAAGSKAFAAGGIYLLNDHVPCPQQLMIDAGPQGTGHSGHGHADALSIRFSLDQHRVLVDPGTFCYISDGNERDSFRGTGAHNTLRVDHLDQAVPQGPFAWSAIPNAKAETWLNGATFDFFVGSHDGYYRLPDPVLHRRFVFHVKGGFWLVRDVASGQGNHLLEMFWHFASEHVVREERGIFFAAHPTAETNRERASLALLIAPGSPWKTEIVEYRISPAYGSEQAAPMVRVSANASLPEDCAVLLLPATEAPDIGTFSALGESSVRGVRGYRYQAARTTEFLFFAAGNNRWTCGPWSSDANLLYCKLERGRFTHVIMVSGSFGEWRGNRFVSHPSRTESFEWLSGQESKKASSEGVIPQDVVVTDFEVVDLPS